MRSLVRRVLALFRRSRLERDIEDELTFHLAMREVERRIGGNPAAAARLATHKQFGSALLVKEQARDAWAFRWLEGVAQDVRHAARALRRSPAFAITTTVTLAIGVVATTVVFSVVDSLLLRPAPFKDAERLVEILRWSSRGGGPAQPASMLPRWREQSHIFEQVEAHWEQSFVLRGAEEPEIFWGSQVTVDLFGMLGAAPQLGRGFAPAESNAPVALISDGFWRRRFGQSSEALGQSLRLEGQSYTVVGVMPRDFRFPVERVDIWIPFDPSLPNPQSPRHQVTAIARLRRDVPFHDADQQVAALAPRLDATLATMPVPGITARLRSMERWGTIGVWSQSARVTEIRTRLFLLFAAGGVLLVLSGVNAANLFMSRSLARIADLSMRAALGAGRARLIRGMVAEAVLISAGASLIGVVTAAWVIGAVAATLPVDISDASLNPVDMDRRAVAWSIMAAAITGLGGALIPARQLVLRDPARGLLPQLVRKTRTDGFARGLLLSAQTCLAVVLLIGAGLMARSLSTLLNLDTGWSGDGVAIVQPQFRGGLYATPVSRSVFLSDLKGAIQSRPGAIAAVAEGVPLRLGAIWFGRLEAEETGIPDAEVWNARVSPEYFAALALRFEHGRAFSPEEEHQPVAVISRSIAQQLWPGVPPLGRRFRFEKTAEWLTVVGVVADVRSTALERGHDPVEVYRPLGGAAGPGSLAHPYRFLVAKAGATDDGETMVGMVKSLAAAIDPELLLEARTTREILRETIAEREFNTRMLVGFALFGIILAGAGVYALIAYETSRRTHELGIRMALGATPSDVVRVVIGRSMALSGAGAAAGLVVAFALGRMMKSMVYGVSPYDAVSYAGALAFLLGTALIAALVPALRATRVDPLVALRHD